MRQQIHEEGAKLSARMLLLLQKLLASWIHHDSILNHPLIRLLKMPAWDGHPPLDYVAGTCERWQSLLNLSRADPLYFDFPTFEYVHFLCQQYAIDLCSVQGTQNQRGFGVALYETSSFLNHSCVPNAIWKINADTDGDMLKLVAIRPISADEEVLVSYTSDDMDYTTRQQDLKRRYGFVCMCTKCKQRK